MTNTEQIFKAFDKKFEREEIDGVIWFSGTLPEAREFLIEALASQRQQILDAVEKYENDIIDRRSWGGSDEIDIKDIKRIIKSL